MTDENEIFRKEGELKMRLFMLEQQFAPELEREKRFEKAKAEAGDVLTETPPRLARRLARYEIHRAELIADIEGFNSSLPDGQKLKHRIKTEEYKKHRREE